jgi:hypothetical protein
MQTPSPESSHQSEESSDLPKMSRSTPCAICKGQPWRTKNKICCEDTSCPMSKVKLSPLDWMMLNGKIKARIARVFNLSSQLLEAANDGDLDLFEELHTAIMAEAD